MSDRVIQGIDFFRKRINPRVAKVTKIQIVNRLFSGDESNVRELLQAPYDHFFNERQVVSNREKFNNLLQEFEDKNLSKEESRERILGHLKEKSPLIEELLFDSAEEESLAGLQFSLTLRNIEAAQHFDGDEEFSQWDLLGTISETLSENWNEFSSSFENLIGSDAQKTSNP